jgi:hypothetical protein
MLRCRGRRRIGMMQSTKELVTRIEVSGCRRADSFYIHSDSYILSVSEKKREEYCHGIPQKCRASSPG